jgi:hypothetical protein
VQEISDIAGANSRKHPTRDYFPRCMAFFIHVLPDVVGELDEHRETLDLPRVFPLFSLRELEDKPQDPIITALSRLDPISERSSVKSSQTKLSVNHVGLVHKNWLPQHSPPDLKASV